MRAAYPALLATLLAVAVATPAHAAPTTGPIKGEVPMRVNEGTHRFDTPTRSVTIRPGVATFTLLNPRGSRNRHGLAISNGKYLFVNGWSIAPGASYTLTLRLGPGHYTIFDPVGSNRRRGYYVKLTVLKNAGGRFRPPGTSCAGMLVAKPSNSYVVGTDCSTAAQVSESVYKIWRANGYSWATITAGEFTCAVDPFTRWGLMIDCVDGGRRVLLKYQQFFL